MVLFIFTQISAVLEIAPKIEYTQQEHNGVGALDPSIESLQQVPPTHFCYVLCLITFCFIVVWILF